MLTSDQLARVMDLVAELLDENGAAWDERGVIAGAAFPGGLVEVKIATYDLENPHDAARHLRERAEQVRRHPVEA